MECGAVKHGIVNRKGKSSLEFFYGGKPYYYCFGYVDSMTDELLDVCSMCKSNVIHAQRDFDLLNGK